MAMIHSQIVPNVLSITSNRTNLKGFPLRENLNTSDHQDRKQDETPSQIHFEVNRNLKISDGKSGKTFGVFQENSVGMDVPIGRLAQISCSVSFEGTHASIQVNPLFYKTGMLTIGNIHSIGWLLRDACNISLVGSGHALLHGAALRNESSCVLLIGLSNTGKTTTVVSMTSNGNAQTFGDDLIVTDGEKAYACPYTTMNIDPSKLQKPRSRFSQRARRLIPFYEYFGPTSPSTLLDHLGQNSIASPTIIDTICFLRRSASKNTKTISSLEATELLIASNAAEFTYTTNSLFRAYDYLMQKDIVAQAENRERSIVQNLCSSAECVLVDGGPSDFSAAAERALETP